MTSVSIGNLVLESGEVLENAELAFERTGNEGGPVVLVCHALTGDQCAVGTADLPGWWSGLIGSGNAVDTNVFQVITFNVLGGCNGSTGPLSTNPKTGKAYRSAFPAITIKDMVQAEYQALKELGISHLAAVIGGSLGGMKTLEWGRSHPEFVDIIFPLAVTPYYSAYGIAFNYIGIQAIENDPHFKNGYYRQSSDIKGFEVARMAGMVTYRSSEMFNQRFGRKPFGHGYDVESYLGYQGQKLANRFDANSYLTLLKAMNTHDIGEEILDVEIFALSFTHDFLYPSELMVPWLESQPRAAWEIIETKFGHDGFLVEFEKWSGFIRKKLEHAIMSKLSI